MKQDSGIGRRNDRDLFQHPLDGWALANDAFEARLGTNLAFEMQLLVSQFAHWGKATSCNSFEVGESNGHAHNLLATFTLAVRCDLLYINAIRRGIRSPHSAGCTWGGRFFGSMEAALILVIDMRTAAVTSEQVQLGTYRATLRVRIPENNGKCTVWHVRHSFGASCSEPRQLSGLVRSSTANVCGAVQVIRKQNRVGRFPRS